MRRYSRQRQALEHPEEQQRRCAGYSPQEELAVHVVHHRHARLAQPQRGQEGDPVDHLEHHVGVAADPAQHRHRSRAGRPSRGCPCGGRRAAGRSARPASRPGSRPPRRSRDVPHGHPAADLRVQVRAVAAGVVVRPVPVGQDQDVQGLRAWSPAMRREKASGPRAGVAHECRAPVSSARWTPTCGSSSRPTTRPATSRRSCARRAASSRRTAPGDWRAAGRGRRLARRHRRARGPAGRRAATASRCCTARARRVWARRTWPASARAAPAAPSS